MMFRMREVMGVGGSTVALLALMVGLSACDEDPARVDADSAPVAPEPGVHAILTQPLGVGAMPAAPGEGRDIVFRPQSETLTLQMYLVKVGVESQISSYQTQLRYDTDLLTFVNGTVPQGIMGTFHEPEPGRIRMVGVALEGIPNDGAFLLEFALAAERGETELLLEIEELTGDVGETDLTEKSIPRQLRLLWDRDMMQETDEPGESDRVLTGNDARSSG